MDYLIFLGVCIVVTFSPGPAVFTAIKNGATHGLKASIIGICGNEAALILMAAISVAGLGAVILASTFLFTILKVVGGLYLAYLGVKIILSRPSTLADAKANATSGISGFALFRESFLVGVSNPKAIAFLLAFFPQFIDPTQPVFWQFVVLGLTFMACSFSALVMYAVAAEGLSRFLKDASILKWFNRITGGVFIGFGASLIASR